MKKIYLAGPDVFRKDAMAHFTEIKNLCDKYGFKGLSPFDNEDFDGVALSKGHSISIFKSNVELIKQCDIIIANLIPFRGACIDDGTAWEIGCGFTLGKIICGYTPYCEHKLKDVTKMMYNIHQQKDFPNIEMFADNCVNLMLQESIELTGGKILPSFESCLIHLQSI